MEIIPLIKKKDFSSIKNEFENKLIDPNFSNMGFSLLWVAINGDIGRPKRTNTDFAEYEIVKFIIEKKADPNKKCVLMTPIYLSVYHNRRDITRLLLIKKANPNDETTTRCKNKKIFMEVPLNIAIRNIDLPMIKLLVLNGAYYNNVTMKKIQFRLKREKDKKKIDAFKKILKFLQKKYKEEFENFVDKMINKPSIKAFPKYYPCFQYEE